MVEEKYKLKIKTVDELVTILEPRPRKSKVIMCHGTFDVVHPGHIRHLLYAKSKADILVASLTCDAHIEKSNFRPYVPEDLRALNLAAFDMVDYVIIDMAPTPLSNLRDIKPDYFAKGFEYVESGLPQKTADEKSVLDEFGGELIFSPGDVVYSSSILIDTAPPNISIEKLLSLMDGYDLTFETFRNTVNKIADARVLVVGDTIVDSYTHVSLIGGQTKTPTISVSYENRTDFVGGAGIVAKHLNSAGADVELLTVLGNDPLREYVENDLTTAGVSINIISDGLRPTTNKNAIVCDSYRLLKIDTVDNQPISNEILEKFCFSISESKADAIIFSDFRHGIFNHTTISAMTESIPEGMFRVADSQVASRWGNILEFQNFDLVTPNEREARFALGDQDSVIRPLAKRLYENLHCKNLILKMGERGLISYQEGFDIEDVRAFFVVDSFADNVVDAVGSGDALLAYATLTHIHSGNLVLASIIGSFAAAIECEKEGNVPVTTEDLFEKIDWVERKSRLHQ
jgi:rfaE bifunctional protein kinase chain/domain